MINYPANESSDSFPQNNGVYGLRAAHDVITSRLALSAASSLVASAASKTPNFDSALKTSFDSQRHDASSASPQTWGQFSIPDPSVNVWDLYVPSLPVIRAVYQATESFRSGRLFVSEARLAGMLYAWCVYEDPCDQNVGGYDGSISDDTYSAAQKNYESHAMANQEFSPWTIEDCVDTGIFNAADSVPSLFHDVKRVLGIEGAMPSSPELCKAWKRIYHESTGRYGPRNCDFRGCGPAFVGIFKQRKNAQAYADNITFLHRLGMTETECAAEILHEKSARQMAYDLAEARALLLKQAILTARGLQKDEQDRLTRLALAQALCRRRDMVAAFGDRSRVALPAWRIGLQSRWSNA